MEIKKEKEVFMTEMNVIKIKGKRVTALSQEDSFTGL